MDDRSLRYARALRKWQERHPVADLAIGFVPGVGQAYGLASTAAALRDPEADKLEKGLAAASFIPGGRIAGKLRKVVVGENTAKGSQYLRDMLALAKDRYNNAPKTVASRGTKKGAKELAQGDPRLNDELARNYGWWKDPDTGKWMHEVGDDQSMPNFPRMEQLAQEARKDPGGFALSQLGDTLHHDELFNLDPSLKNIFHQVDPAMGRGSGIYRPQLDMITTSAAKRGEPVESLGKVRESQLHELQHAIADREGFSPGTSITNTGDQIEDFRRYLADPGEIIARVTQVRRNMTPEARKKLPYHKHVEIERLRVHNKDIHESIREPGQGDVKRALRDVGEDPNTMMYPNP